MHKSNSRCLLKFKQVTEIMIPSFDVWQYGLPLFMLVHKPPQLCFVISIIQFLLSATAEYVINLLSLLNSQ